jgi:DNA-binding transcriptional LysR family regulator
VLAEELHFGRAAARLHIAQPALSQQIKRLELQLGIRLVDRTRASVALSEAGAAVLTPARAAVQAADAAEETARAFASGEQGELRLGFSPGAHYVAQALLEELARRHPRITVRAQQDSTGALAAAIKHNRLDVAIGICAEGDAEPLLEVPAVLAVAESHRLATRTQVRLDELREETFALVDAADGPGYNRAVQAHCRQAGFEPKTAPDPAGPLIWETAVRSGGCVGLTARTAAASTTRGIRLLELDPTIHFPIQLMHSETWRPPARAFAQLAHQTRLAES